MKTKKRKPDPAHLETDRTLEKLEKRLRKEYLIASKEVEEKAADYYRRFAIKDEKWQAWVKSGRKTEQEYKDWRIGQMAVGERWVALRDKLAREYHNANVLARKIIDGEVAGVYANNRNYAAYEVESGLGVDASFALYDRESVANMMSEDPEMLPPPGRKVAKRIAEGIDVRWNNERIQSVATQAILQGMNIEEIARRLASEVGDSNFKAAIRNARTMVTGAENAGRVNGYKHAEAMGIDLREKWLATLDSRTRHEHRVLDGQSVGVGEEFEVDGHKLRFPGDPWAPGYLVYNCRCALIADLKGFEFDLSDLGMRRSEKLEGMSYAEWKAEKESTSNPITLPMEKAAELKASYILEYKLLQ